MTDKNNPRRGIRHQTSQAPRYFFPREPTIADKKDPMTNKFYEVGSFGIIGRNPINGIPVKTGTEGQIWYLSRFESNGDATWLPFSSGTSPAALKFRDQADAEVVPTGAGLTDWNGATIGAGLNPSGIPLESVKVDANTMKYQIQISDAITVPANENNAGICSFDTSAFDVDANGWVQLKGGSGPAIDSVTVDNNTGPGTNPVLADGSGNTNVMGAVVAAHSVPVDVHSRALNTYNVEVQVGATNTGAPSSKAKAGLVQFDDTTFAVDADGYVTSIGGVSAGFIWREESGTSATFVENEGIFANNAGTVTLTLPASCPVGTAFAAYQEGAGKVRIDYGTSDIIRFGTSTSTVTTGYIESLNQGDSVQIVCAGTNRFRVISSEGTWTIS